MNLPQLTNGSPKQLRWAYKIRHSVFTMIQQQIGDVDKNNLAVELLNVDDCTWWIMHATKKRFTERAIKAMLGIRDEPVKPTMTHEEFAQMKAKLFR